MTWVKVHVGILLGNEIADTLAKDGALPQDRTFTTSQGDWRDQLHAFIESCALRLSLRVAPSHVASHSHHMNYTTHVDLNPRGGQNRPRQHKTLPA